ncbi:TOBE domain-containing protein [Streptomyces sp. NBC_00048]|uniref:TOBE domain-containing protein n=1 Tax=Streptomyces sp. NBC_00048 TaxID=2975628 RepID=UPI003865E389
MAGTVTAVTTGEAMATVRLDGGQDIIAAITEDAVEALGLSVGSSVVALIKATEISLVTA